MRKLHTLSILIAAVLFCTGAAFGADAPVAQEDGQAIVLSESSRALLAQLELDLPFLYDQVQAAIGSEGCAPPVEQLGTGHAHCNDKCFAAYQDCYQNCNGNPTCEDQCAQDEFCCNCSCGAIPPGACAWQGCF